jgi:predicted nucleic acid-binding protein
MIVLDTTVLIDLLRGHDPARRFLSELTEVPACSEVTRVELLRGVEDSERRGVDRLMATIAWVPVDETIARMAGDLGQRYRRSHQGLAIADLLIAATAHRLSARLATSNVRHYPMFPRLRAPY